MIPIPWFKIDDGFWSHPKTLQLSDGAIALWVRSGSWSMHHLTDGHIPSHSLRILSAKPKYIDELRSVSLWFSVTDGYQFHDWDKYQPSRAQVEADRDAAAERKRRSREKSQRDSRVTDGGVTEGVTPTPTRPDPTRPISTSKEVERPPRKRGVRLSPDWMPSEESRAKAREDAPNVDHRSEHAVFIDYWIAQPGQKGVKTDWEATWRNWMRRKEADLASNRSRGSGSRPTRTEENLAYVQSVSSLYADEQLEIGQ